MQNISFPGHLLGIRKGDTEIKIIGGPGWSIE